MTRHLGRQLVWLVREVRALHTLLVRAGASLAARRFSGSEVIEQTYRFTNESLSFIAVTMGFVAMIMVYQACSQALRSASVFRVSQAASSTTSCAPRTGFMAEPIDVEVAYAEPERQFLRRVSVAAGATVADAIAASGVERELGIDAAALGVGIWSKPVARDARVGAGDRVELYRALVADPKEARRRRADRSRQP